MNIRKSLSVATHVIVLGALLLFSVYPLTLPFSLPNEFWYWQAYQLLLWLTLFYCNMYIFVPKLLLRGRSFEFTLVILAALAFMLSAKQILTKLHRLDDKIIEVNLNNDHAVYPEFGLALTFISVIVTLMLFVIGTSIKVGDQLHADQRRKQTLLQEKVSSELAFLRAQINPHFLFNVLHSIYALAEMDAAKSQDAIYTLSKMMRYVLYESKHQQTTVEKEINFIENYIKLMKLRTTAITQIEFERPAQIKDQYIAPMLILPFIENAFKHGVSSYEKSVIYIAIFQHETYVELIVRNPIFSKKGADLEEDSGIGLTNTSRRLELLYPEKHRLHAGANEHNEFLVNLKIFVR